MNMRFDSSSKDKTIVIKRSDVERVHDWARENCSLRDFLLIRLPMKIGLRNSEIRMLRIENINFENRTFQVLDSKKYELFLLPLDVLTLQLIQDLIGKRQEGYVFPHTGSWTSVKCDMPLSRVQIWQIVHDIAEQAGVKGFNPRLLRHYFAAYWIYVEKKSVVTLQGLMRHSDLSVTFFYTRRLTFFEDWQREYDGVKNGPFLEFEQESISLEDSICKRCSNLPLCKYAPLASCASSCRFYAPKQEVVTTHAA